MHNKLPLQAKAVSPAMCHKQGASGMLGVGPWEVSLDVHTINKSSRLSSSHLSSPITGKPRR